MKTNKSLFQMKYLKWKLSKRYQLLELEDQADICRFLYKRAQYKAFYIPKRKKYNSRQIKKFEKQYYTNFKLCQDIERKIEELKYD